jgi:hypothetical protein
MTSCKRFGNRWTINECLQLEREFDLLELSIDEIAERHQRTPNAIMIKLDSEGHADYNILYSNYHTLNSHMNTQKTNQTEESDEEEEYNESEEEEEYNESDEEEEELSLKLQVMQLEKKLNDLTDFIMKQSKKGNGISLF